MRYRIGALRVATLAALPVLVALAGCASEYGDTAKVTGTVTYKGKPVPNMMVNYMPIGEKGGRPSWGKTDTGGKYEMVLDENNKGVLMGRHKVYITPPATTIDGGTSKESKKAIAAAAGLTTEELLDIRSKYGAEDVTKYEVDVTKSFQVVDIKLE